MSDKKQTALQWLDIVLISEPYSEEDFEYNEKCWEQAIQMEREQIIRAANNGCKGMCMIDASRDGKQYYQKTYGGQDE